MSMCDVVMVAKSVDTLAGTRPQADTSELESEIDQLVYQLSPAGMRSRLWRIRNNFRERLDCRLHERKYEKIKKLA
jgi:hypothetical protein